MSLKKKLSVTKGITESPEAKLPGFFLSFLRSTHFLCDSDIYSLLLRLDTISIPFTFLPRN